jgi:hypothetical protein
VIARFVRAGLTLAVVSVPAAAQFSSDFPGVPRGAISIRGSKQARTEWTLGYNTIPAGASAGDTVGFGVRLGFGRSYRVRDQFEIGFDYSFLDLAYQQPPAAAAGAPETKSYIRGLAGFGFRVGAKMRAYSSIDQDGYGYQASFGIAYQPSLKALIGAEYVGDSSRIGGQFSEAKPASPGSAFKHNPFASMYSGITLGAMGSYRSRRLLADAALMNESSSDPAAGEDPSPITPYDGISLRVGGAYRLTRSIAVGGSFWGSGSPPWRDEVRLGIAGKPKATQLALLFQFGSQPEGGTDLMISSPTGNFAESVQLYFRTRSTR